MSMLRYLRLSTLLLLLIFLAGACGSPTQLKTSSMQVRPTVDASIEEWEGRFTDVDDQSVSAAAHPTDSLLYVAILIQDRRLVQSIAGNGLILWVDPTGGTQRRYGVQYPLGIRRQMAGQTSAGGGQPRVQFGDVSLAELEIVRGDSLRQRIPARFSEGLRSKATLDPSSLIYEIAIPVGPPPSSTEWHGLRTSLGSTVGLGLEIPQPDEEMEVQDRTAGAPSMTGRRGRRRRQRRRQRRRRRSQAQQLASLDVWMTISAP